MRWCSRVDLEEKWDDHLAMLMNDVETRQKCFSFTCMQLVGTLDGSKKWTGHCCGNFFIPYFTNGFVLSLFYKIAKTSYLSPLLILKSCCVTVSFFNIEELLRYRRKEPQK